MGACFDVYRDKRNGFLEAVYQECLCFELAHHQVPFEEQPTLELTYKGHQLKQTYMPDFLCFGEVIVEIKAIRTLTDEHRAQVINYLKGSIPLLWGLSTERIHRCHRLKLAPSA